MRGLTPLLLAIIVLVISIFILLAILGIYTLSPQGVDTSTVPSYIKDSFDYTAYILDENPIDTDTYDECEKLINAIKNAILTGKPQKVDEISYGTDLSSPVYFNGQNFPFIGDCFAVEGEEIVTALTYGLEQKVCTFRRITSNVMQGDGGTSPGGISDASKLYFDDCVYIPESQIQLLVAGQIGPIENFNSATRGVNIYYSPDYIYTQNGDFGHFPDLNDPSDFFNAYNGPGRLKIYVGDATSDINGNCKFNIYFCPRPAIAKSVNNATIGIFDIFRKLELYELLIKPYYIRNLTDQANSMSGYDDYRVYYWNEYDIPLDGSYSVATIINAIKAGLYENVFSKNYFWAHPHWDISRDHSIGKPACWESDYDSLIMPNVENNRTHSIRFNCDDDNICGGILRVKIGIRRDTNYEDIDGDGKDEALNYISGVISFCGSIKPVADFIESAHEVNPGEVITFTSNSHDPDGTIVSYEWDFGDGTTSTLVNPSHSYSTTGSYTVTLTVTDDEGAQRSKSETKCVYVCGNGVKECSEECDNATDNGIACTPGYGEKCGWCDNNCQVHIETGPYCGDGIKNGPEVCDPVASPTGCAINEICDSTCACAERDYTCDSATGIETDPYLVTRKCRFGCNGNRCWGGKWCPSKGGQAQGCGDTSAICTGTECWTTAQCIREDSSPPTCSWIDRIGCIICGLTCPCSGTCEGICCRHNRICTASCIDDDECTYECDDSDGGINFYTKGTCIDGDSSDTDYCVTGTTIVEHYCSGSKTCVGWMIGCPGSCINGACV